MPGIKVTIRDGGSSVRAIGEQLAAERTRPPRSAVNWHQEAVRRLLADAEQRQAEQAAVAASVRR